MDYIKRSMLHLLAEEKDDIQKMRDFLDIKGEFELTEGDYSEAQIALLNPAAVTGAPECINKVLTTELPSLFFDYSIEIGRIHSTRATRDEPGEFDYEVASETISLDTKEHPGLFTDEEIAQLNAFFTTDKAREIDAGFFERLEQEAVDAKAEDYDGPDYEEDEDY